MLYIIRALVFSALFVSSILAIDLSYSDITVVNDSNSFIANNPNVVLKPFNKITQIKGKYIFKAGQRINGDRLAVTSSDQTQFTKSENVEVVIRYPANGFDGVTITAIEIYVAVSSDDANAYTYGGGTGQTYAEMLLTSSRTTFYSYEIYIYGY